MVFDNFCSTKLSLCLGSDEKTHHLKNKTSQSFDLVDQDQLSLPSLTLGLSLFPAITQQLNHAVKDEDLGGNTNSNTMQHGQASNSAVMSAVSSFSNGTSVKRERTEVMSFEDVEVLDTDFTKVDDNKDHYEEVGPRKKLRLTKDQSLVLEESFKDHCTLSLKEKQALANMLNLRPRQVEVWFQNRRARTKLKQTEIDTEILKKCCESLKEENTRLHKELDDLKSSLFYMPLPAAATTTLNMCSSCQRIGRAATSPATGENPSKISFSMGARTFFYNPNANHSAACW